MVTHVVVGSPRVGLKVSERVAERTDAVAMVSALQAADLQAQLSGFADVESSEQPAGARAADNDAKRTAALAVHHHAVDLAQISQLILMRCRKLEQLVSRTPYEEGAQL